MKVPVSYEVARQMLEEAQTPEELDLAIAECSRAMLSDLESLTHQLRTWMDDMDLDS